MDEFEDDAEHLQPSKTALKRQMTALQKLGETLVELSDKELARMPIEDDRVREVIHEARGIRSHSARRRHLQYLGKLMRGIDPIPIEQALEALHQRRRGNAEAFHRLEQWRERLLQEGDPAVQALLDAFPGGDRQLLRQLIRQHRREAEAGKPPAASRKLFRYLRELGGED